MEASTRLLVVHTLELDAHNNAKHYRCDRFNSAQFRVGSSLFGRPITLYSNYVHEWRTFRRNDYTVVEFGADESAFVRFDNCGTFHFFYTENERKDAIIGSFYIVVNPRLRVGQQLCRDVSINAIQCQTVLAKCLGKLDTWKSKLEVSKKSGYNMIHFTPIQELGASNSSYSLKDHLKLNPVFSDDRKQYTMHDVSNLIDYMRHEWNMLSITDIVLNHTANESEFLDTHPESAYNCLNSPWLRPAYLLDRLLWHLTCDIVDDRWKSLSLTTKINTESHLNILRNVIRDHYLPTINLHELFMVDANKIVKKFEVKLRDYCAYSDIIKPNQSYEEIAVIQDEKYKRFASTIDIENAINVVVNTIKFKGDKEEWFEWSCEYIRLQLNDINHQIQKEVNYHLKAAVENVISAVRYERIDINGPKIELVSKKQPLVPQYFKHRGADRDLISEEKQMYNDSESQYLMAHNGWVMNDDPLRNFADKDSNVYIRRELIAWGDSVKLRYGSSPDDSPFLWSYIETYVTQMARTFHGLRLDNCHSTPLNVAEYMIDAARRVNQDLYLVAELFTSNEELDNIFVNKLGINSLIRESNTASNAHDMGRQVHRFGGEPVGSFPPETITAQKSKFLIRLLQPTITHAIFFDLTHDNESTIKKRSAYDPLPSSAVVAMTNSAIGSNRGYDELVPHHIHVVNESRQYRVWSDEDNDDNLFKQSLPSVVSNKTGIIEAKKEFNFLHEYLGENGFSQSYIDQRDVNIIAVTRHNPETHESVILVARTAFKPPSDPLATGNIAPLTIEGIIEQILFETGMSGTPDKVFVENADYINGYQEFNAPIRRNISINESHLIESIHSNGSNEIVFFNFPPSSVIAFKVSLSDYHLNAINKIKNIVKQFDDSESEINSIIGELSLLDINIILFRCDHEERDETGNGTYQIPSIGSLNYCGIAGVMYHLRHIRTNNDLGHQLCENLRKGDWLTNYIANRLSSQKRTSLLSEWLSSAFEPLSQLPRYLIPRYFDAIITPLYSLILDRVWSLSSIFIKNGSRFAQLLTLGGVALIGVNSTSPLPPLSPKVTNSSTSISTIAAGLPHFASGYMRVWGRDTFISLKGLLLLTGRNDEAKQIILGFAGALRHGLIPNLLDGGMKSRYNCRDAVWLWLQAIKDYCLLTPNGVQLLSLPVRRLYPTDDSPPLVKDDEVVEQPLYDVIQEALQKHFTGIDFIERNAGTSIDAHMTYEGFHIQIGVSRETGFVFGGNDKNCGTWMDKMGSSSKANNKGHPRTPRDGSAVEIVGLSKSVITWLADINDKLEYPYDGVSSSDGTKLTYREWADLIQLNFEKYFYIPSDDNNSLINRRLIYKDSYGATHKWQDFQFRPNFLISIVVAPELFDRNKTIEALELVKNTLVGPLGIKTLDPSDWNYRPNYDNSNDTDDYNTAHGFNYHNGPEWLWLMGYYLQAIIKFNDNLKNTAIEVQHILAKHYEYIENSEWYGLPELTNADGVDCSYSCPIQAWSHSTLLEVLHLIDLINLDSLE